MKSIFEIDRLLLLTVVLLLMAVSIGAQTVQDSTRQVKLNEVMVTAAKVEMPVNQAAKFVSVITKEQIAQAPVQSIQELLAYAANVDVVQRGGHGVQADVSIRGGTFDENAVLLNGINISNAHTGHYSFDIPINLSDIERIEIVHGPAALIYGTSAFSGGINIITKKDVRDKLYAKIEGGMHKMAGVEVRGASKVGIMTNSMSFGYGSSGGYIANSDYDIYNALWQTRFQLNGDSKLDLQLGYNNKHYGANTFYSAKYPNQYERTSNYLGSLKGEFGTALKVIPILFWDRHYDQFDLIKNTATGRNFHRNDTYGGNLIFLYQSKLGTTSLGGEVRREDIMSSVLGKPLAEPHGKYKMYDDRTNTSVTLEHTVNWNCFAISAGVLMNHNTLLSGEYKFFPSVSATYRPADCFSVSSSWSKSTRMPTFVDLYYTTETHNGNEGLKPERSESVDLTFKYNTPLLRAYLTGFLQWGRDMIDWVKDDSSATKWSSWNLSKLNTQGVEMGVDLDLGQLFPVLGNRSRLALDYTRMNSEHDAKNLISHYALNYLRDKFTVRFNHPIWKGLSAGWYFRYQKRMGTYEKYVDLKKVGDEAYPTFSTLDLKLDYLYKEVLFSVNLNNLYNTRYFDLGNIPQAGFWLSGAISYTFR